MKNLIVFLFCPIFLIAAKQSCAEEKLVYKDTVFTSNIRSVLLFVDPLQLSDPIIPLNGGTVLHFMFDDLDNDSKNYFYTIVHCEHDWTASDLAPMEYLSGFESQPFLNRDFSFGTNQSYSHYELLFPNSDISITKSGNYALVIFVDDDRSQTVLTRRFMVVENKLVINTDVHRPVDPAYAREKQEVDFTLSYSGMSIPNPFNDLHVVLMQNFRWDRQITDLKPLFVRSNGLDYNYNHGNWFDAGKEFRRFDTRSIHYNTDRVAKITTDNGGTNVWLIPESSRADLPYFCEKDADGKFIPGIMEMPDQNLDADYVWVHFFLAYSYPFYGGKMYINGKFSDWQLQDQYRLQYNPDKKGYEGMAYLKQGYYEFEYDYLENDAATPSSSLLDGDWYETENTYQVLVYYHPFGNRYDELIGYKSTNSFNTVK